MSAGAQERVLSMFKSMKKDNKGFSLVELIVVIAIMGIMAVALTPRITHYIDKAKKSNDNQIVDAISTSVQLALVDGKIYKEVEDKGLTRKIIPLLKFNSADTVKKYQFDDTTITSPLLKKEIDSVVGTEFVFKSDEAKNGATASPDAEGNISSYMDQIYLIINSNYSYSLYLVYGSKVSPSNYALYTGSTTTDSAMKAAIAALKTDATSSYYLEK